MHVQQGLGARPFALDAAEYTAAAPLRSSLKPKWVTVYSTCALHITKQTIANAVWATRQREDQLTEKRERCSEDATQLLTFQTPPCESGRIHEPTSAGTLAPNTTNNNTVHAHHSKTPQLANAPLHNGVAPAFLVSLDF